MLALENQAIADYQGLLGECKSRFHNHSIIENLERLISDEKKHALLVRELIQILERQPD